MEHRHLNHQNYTLAAIDDCIANGSLIDWKKLSLALKSDPTILNKICKICKANLSDPYQQRYFFWLNYIEQRFGYMG